MPASVNIYIIGAPRTGKTTLFQNLLHAFQQDAATFIPGLELEQPHAIMDVATNPFIGETRADGLDETAILQQTLLMNQHAAEMSLNDSGNWFISDQSGLDRLVCTALCCDVVHVEIIELDRIWKQMRDGMRKSLVVLCQPGPSGSGSVGAADSMFRTQVANQDKAHVKFRQKLQQHEITFEVLPAHITDKDARARFVMRKWIERCYKLEHDRIKEMLDDSEVRASASQ